MKIPIAILLSVIIIASAACSSKNIKVVFDNQSMRTIDSAVVYVQNRRFVISDILPGSSLQKNISRDSIKFNQHDMMVRVLVYDQVTPHGREGMYYNDLIFAESEDKFIITTSQDLKVTVVPDR